ncbi:MAG: hypothetical protein ABH851_04960 [Methanobacteriota archaeon]
MTRLELLAKQLDAEASESEKMATQNIFSSSMDFWLLCLEAKKILLDYEIPPVNRQQEKEAEKL